MSKGGIKKEQQILLKIEKHIYKRETSKNP